MQTQGTSVTRFFIGEAIFHINIVNSQTCRIWGSINWHALIEHVQESPTVNMWCNIMLNHIIGSFS